MLGAFLPALRARARLHADLGIKTRPVTSKTVLIRQKRSPRRPTVFTCVHTTIHDAGAAWRAASAIHAAITNVVHAPGPGAAGRPGTACSAIMNSLTAHVHVQMRHCAHVRQPMLAGRYVEGMVSTAVLTARCGSMVHCIYCDGTGRSRREGVCAPGCDIPLPCSRP